VSTKEQRIGEIVAAHAGREGPLMPILHDIQAEFGCVDGETEKLVAQGLNLRRADVHGVVSFYHDFHDHADARPEVQICRAEACQARGVEALAPVFETDQRVEVETVYCLGLCASGPSAMVGDRVFARLDEAGARKLIGEVVG